MNNLAAIPKPFSISASRETTYKNDFVLEVTDQLNKKTISFGANYNKDPEAEALYIAKCLSTLSVKSLSGYDKIEAGLDLNNLPSVKLINKYLKSGVKLTIGA